MMESGKPEPVIGSDADPKTISESKNISDVKKKKKHKLSLWELILFDVLILLLTGAALFFGESRITENAQERNLRHRLKSASDYYARTQEIENSIEDIYSMNMYAKAGLLAWLMDHEPEISEEKLAEYGISAESIVPAGQAQDPSFMYYTAYREDGTEVTIGVPREDYEFLRDNLYMTQKSGQNAAGSDSTVFIVTDLEGTILQYADDAWIGKNAAGLIGTDYEDVPEEGTKWLSIDGTSCIFVGKTDEKLGKIFWFGLKAEDLRSNILFVVSIMLAFISLFFVFLTTFSYFTKQEGGKSGNEKYVYSRENVARKIILLGSVYLILTVAVTGFAQTLIIMTQNTIEASDTMEVMKQNADQTESMYALMEDDINSRSIDAASCIASILRDYPETRTRQGLQALSDIFSLEYIMLFDREGAEIVSDSQIVGYRISEDPEGQSYEFRKLLNGAPYLVQGVLPDELTRVEHQLVGVPFYNKKGELDGFVQIAVIPENYEVLMKEGTLDVILEQLASGSGMVFFVVNEETGEITYSGADQELTGMKAVDAGFGESQLKNRFFGTITVDGEKYHAISSLRDGNLIFAATSSRSLFQGRAKMIIFTLGVCTIALFLFWIFIRRQNVPKMVRVDKDYYVDVTTADGGEKTAMSIISRAMRQRVRWRERLPEEKSSFIIKIMMMGFAVLITAIYIFQDILFDEATIFGFLLSGGWERGFNVFAVAEIVVIVTIYVFVTTIINWMLENLISMSGPGSETLLRLLKSFFHYAGILLIMYYCLYVLGIDPRTLLVSAGLLTLAISLGAKDLITDIIAGLFIIFERDVQVGDIIEVSGFKGRVLEIGLRTTKILDTGTNDVKSVNNRDLTNILNKTKQTSKCVVKLPVRIDNSITEVEEMLLKELPRLRRCSPYILSGPSYSGLEEITDKFMTITVKADCPEVRLSAVRTALNRELKILFEQYGFALGWLPGDYRDESAQEKEK